MSDKKSYRKLEEELNSILDRVENSNYDELEDLIKDYDKGKEIITQLEKRLESAKNTITNSSKD